MATAAIKPVPWSMVRNYQTLQYYHVAIDPQSGQNNFIGASQDNGTSVRLSPGNDHFKIFSGDGGTAAIAAVGQSSFTFYGSSQYGRIHRDITNSFNEITPSGLTAVPGIPDAFGEFVTYFKLDAENPQDLYYVNFNRLFRTINASTVTSAGWTELTGVRIAINPANPANGTNIGIRALELSHGPYFPSHALFIGTTNGKVFRLDNPRGAPASTSPVDITPPVVEGLRTQGRAVTISDIASNPNDDNELMVTVSNYSVTLANNTTKTDFKIWWTNNAKSITPTWKLVQGNLILPSIRSCQIVVKKDASNASVTEYYVGTSVGFYSALSIGSAGTPTWVREGGNVLNYAVINSLDYRPLDNILLLGTHGNGMFFASTGTPDYRPNLNTGLNDPVRNDKNFIRLAFPSIVKDKIDYRVGNMTQIRKVIIQIYTVTGQLVQRKQTAYADGETAVKQLARGAYILQITSEDNKQQFLQKFVKD
jgi:hypothetical protein